METMIGSTKLCIDEIFRSNPHVHRVAFDIILEAAKKIDFSSLSGEVSITSWSGKCGAEPRTVGWCSPRTNNRVEITILTQVLVAVTRDSPHRISVKDSFAFTVAHELAHAHQYFRGDLSLEYNNRAKAWCHIWKNRIYTNDYAYEKRPWEVEANQIARKVTGFKRPSSSKLFTQEDFKITPRS
jgi:hypothetical protein